MKRILTAAILVPTIVGTVLWAPYWLLLVVLALVGAGAFLEYDQIAKAHGFIPGGWVGLAAGLAFLLMPSAGAPSLILIAAVLMGLSLTMADLSKALPSVAVTLLGIVYIFGAWHCAILLREANAHWLMIALIVSWAGDTAAMYSGKAWGRHKLAPRISPGKTQEGALASLIAGTLVAVIYGAILLPNESVAVVAVIGAVANAAGQLGDLCESAFKRGAGVKDSGTMLPGHGGWLDRIDSSLFSVPAVYAVLLLR